MPTEICLHIIHSYVFSISAICWKVCLKPAGATEYNRLQCDRVRRIPNVLSRISRCLLEALSNVMKANMLSAIKRGLDPELDSGLVTDDVRECALKLIYDRVITVAGLAKVLLVMLHPKLPEDQKRGALPSAALAYTATDTDGLTGGERRLLASIVRQYTRQRWVG